MCVCNIIYISSAYYFCHKPLVTSIMCFFSIRHGISAWGFLESPAPWWAFPGNGEAPSTGRLVDVWWGKR